MAVVVIRPGAPRLQAAAGVVFLSRSRGVLSGWKFRWADLTSEGQTHINHQDGHIAYESALYPNRQGRC
jgi:hypothetical protein